jgi:UDP-glucose 4-epimerase
MAGTEINLHAALLDAAIVAQARKIILLSSGGTVYGDPRGFAPLQEDQPVAPVSRYGVVKVQVEEMFKAAARGGLIDCVIGRLSNPYGPGQINRRAQGLVASIFACLIERRPIQIWGDGRNTRDYIYIDDARDGLIEAGDLPCGSIVHVSSGEGRSTRQVVEDAVNVLNADLKVEFDLTRNAGILYSVLSNGLLRSTTAWSPRTSWSEGLIKTARWWLDKGRGDVKAEK